MTAAPSPADPTVGRYRPFLKIGQGGMADVYLAVSRATPGFERLAVIKRLRADLLVEEDDNPQDAAHFIAMFRDEARLAILLKHANIVHTYDVFEDKDQLFLVMEYIEGQSLSSIQRLLAKTSRKLPVDQAAVVIAEILGGLHYAHELKDYSGQPLNIVHRDVSPQNILVGYDGTIKLVDFGVAKVNFRSTQTRAGTMKGKARYMAPEQVTNKGVDRRADVYSAGVLLWELVAGKKLVNGANMYEQLVNVLKTPSPPLSSVVPDVDPALDAIVAKALAREPSERFDTAAQMQDELRTFVSRVTGARGEDVGAFVAREFAPQRAHVAKVIAERMASEQADSGLRPVEAAISVFVELDQNEEHVLSSGGFNSSGGSSSRLLPTDSTDSTGSGPRSVPSVGMPATQVSAVPMHFSSTPAVSQPLAPPPEPEEARKKRVPWLMVGAGAAVVLVAFLGGSLMTRKPADPAAPSAASSPHTSAPATSPVLATAMPTAETPTVAPKDTAPRPAEPPVNATPSPVRPAPVAAPPRPAYAWSPPPPPPAPHPPQPKEESAAAAEAPGFLTMDTYPWTKVSVDGKAVGSTPLVHFALAPGAHSITMDNPAENVHQSTSVVIKSGETVSKRLAFEAK